MRIKKCYVETDSLQKMVAFLMLNGTMNMFTSDGEVYALDGAK